MAIDLVEQSTGKEFAVLRVTPVYAGGEGPLEPVGVAFTLRDADGKYRIVGDADVEGSSEGDPRFLVKR